MDCESGLREYSRRGGLTRQYRLGLERFLWAADLSLDQTRAAAGFDGAGAVQRHLR